MNGKELCENLGVRRRKLTSWIRDGLPHGRKGRAYEFDAEAVAEWLVANGHAKPRPIAGTLAEVAGHFEVAERTVAYWRAQGMPGEPGVYDLEAIARWREARTGEQGDRSEEETTAAEGRRLDNELKRLKLEQARGLIMERDAARRLFIRHVYEAKALLDQVPDRVMAALPAKTQAKTRKRVHGEVLRIVDDACRSLAEILVDPDTSGFETKKMGELTEETLAALEKIYERFAPRRK